MIRRSMSCFLLLVLVLALIAMPASATETEPVTTETVPVETASEDTPVETEETVPAQTEETVPAETVEETLPHEDCALAQQELEELREQQEKSRRNGMILLGVAAVLLILVIVFLCLWRKAVKKQKTIRAALKKRPAKAVSVGKVHGIGKRKNQQDSFAVSGEGECDGAGILAVVADGMGGMENGENMSQFAVVSAMEAFLNGNAAGSEGLLQILQYVQGQVLAGNAPAGGTTLLLGLVREGIFHFASVGDSRIVLYRDGTLQHLNREHSYLYPLLQKAVNGEMPLEEALDHEEGSRLASFVGQQQIAEMDIPMAGVPLLAKDRIVLMSDGVYNALTDRELCLALQHPAQEAAEAIESFIRERNYPDQDNYTAVILECI